MQAVRLSAAHTSTKETYASENQAEMKATASKTVYVRKQTWKQEFLKSLQESHFLFVYHQCMKSSSELQTLLTSGWEVIYLRSDYMCEAQGLLGALQHCYQGSQPRIQLPFKPMHLYCFPKCLC